MSILRRVLPAFLLLCALSAGSAPAGDGYFGLQQIVRGTIRGSHQPYKFQADGRGGEYWVRMNHKPDFVEDVRVRWKFSKDISTLKTGEKFTTTLYIDVPKAGPKSADPFTKTYSSRANYQLSAGNSGYLVPKIKSLVEKKYRHAFSGSVAGFYARGLAKPGRPIGSHSGQFQVEKSIVPTQPYSWFTINSIAQAYGDSSDGKLDRTCYYEVLYLFKANTPSKVRAGSASGRTGSGSTGTGSNRPSGSPKLHSFNKRYVRIQNATPDTFTVYYKYRNNKSGSWKWYPESGWIKKTVPSSKTVDFTDGGKKVIASRVRYYTVSSSGRRAETYRTKDMWVAKDRYSSPSRGTHTIRITK